MGGLPTSARGSDEVRTLCPESVRSVRPGRTGHTPPPLQGWCVRCPPLSAGKMCPRSVRTGGLRMSRSPSTALAPIEPAPAAPMPAFSGAAMTQSFTAYQDVQRALDQAMPDQILRIDGRPFRKKGFWRGIATAFNLTLELVE